MSAKFEAPPSLHRGEGELPFVPFGEGVSLQLLQVDLGQGLWIIRQRMEPGITLPTHYHTGPVNAFTIAGAWKYVEYPEVNIAGSYLFEPAASVHTLHTPAGHDLTDVWFSILGPNLNLDADGKVYEILDARRVLRIYMSRCYSAGLVPPAVIGADHEIRQYWDDKHSAATR